MASRNTSAAASNESAIAPLPFSDRPCRTGGLADAQDAVIQTAGQQAEVFSMPEAIASTHGFEVRRHSRSPGLASLLPSLADASAPCRALARLPGVPGAPPREPFLPNAIQPRSTSQV